jgi:ComEC/Rec2-related protein
LPGRTNQHNPVRAARARAAWALLFLALGLLCSWEFPEAGVAIPFSSLTLFLLSALIAAVALVAPLVSTGHQGQRRFPALCLGVAVFTFALAWGQTRLREPVASDLSAPSLQSKELPILRLTILDNPRTKSGGESWSCLARIRALVDDVGNTPVNRNVWLSVRSGSPPRPGDRLIARGLFRPVEPPRNPGEFDLRRWANDRDIVGSLHVTAAPLIRPDESRAGFLESASNFYRRVIGLLRARAGTTVDALASRASPDSQQLLRGLLLGENPPSPSEGLASFYQLGLAHILSISGFHLMVFAAAALFALRLFGDLGRLEPLLVALAILLFLAIVPASSPLVRAATILLVLLGAECFGRRYDRLTLLCWTAVAVLIFRPSELWSLGFQLSFGLTAAILALAQRLSLRLFPPPLGIRPRTHWFWSRARHALIALFVTGLLCWAISAPWVAANVGIFNPLSIITGIVITPIIVLALWIGYAALLLSLVFSPLALAIAVPMGAIADLAVAAARWWDSLPVAVIRLPPLSPIWALASSALIVLFLVRGRIRPRYFAAPACALIAWAVLDGSLSHRLPAQVSARVYLLDESPANCTIIRTPTHAYMINAGTSSPASQGRDLAQVARLLGAWRLDALLIDGSDARAASGAPEVIRTLRPAELILSGDPASAPPHVHALISLAANFGTRVRTVPSFEAALDVLPPPFQRGLPTRSDAGSRGMEIVDYPSSAE